jgi:flagellar basal body-associated protein FliL
MSEPVAAAAPKKKGKLPIIIALVAVLGGGGFFMMKKGGKKVVPPIKLGPISDIKEEFLVNLRDSSGTYLRTSVSIQFADTVKAEEVEKTMSAIQDIINARLRSKSLSEIKTLDGTKLLKREIAFDINGMMDDKKDEKKDEPADDSAKDSKDSKDEKDSKDAKDAPPDPAAEDKELKEAKMPDGWDSKKGPVLKVLFRSFAWQ